MDPFEFRIIRSNNEIRYLSILGIELINGKAFVTETPVDELRHYAEDAGKSKEEIEAITEPKEELKIIASGAALENTMKQDKQ